MGRDGPMGSARFQPGLAGRLPGRAGLALVLNSYAGLRFNLSREDGTIVSTVRVETKLANISVVVVSSLLLGYYFLENFAFRP
jgi:hypothetical protein